MPEEFEEYGGSKEYRYLGPPGTGKTFKANQIAEHGAGKFGADNVMLTSFSTAAAAVLAGRTKIPHQNIGTLHSMAYRSIGNPGMPSKKNLADWNEAYPEYFMGKLGSRDNEDDEETGGWDTSSPGNKYLEQRDRLLNLERPVSVWHHQMRLFHTKWEDFKQQCAVIDFHDMIAIALREVEYAPGRPAVIMADEAQDFTKPQANLIRKWGKHTEYFLLIGDDDQCQPPDTMIHTPDGLKPLGELNPDSDSILSWSKDDSVIFGMRNPIRFRRQDSHADELLKVKAGERESRCTKNHLWMTKWNYPVADQMYVVYLMHLAGKWRIGWTKLMRADHTLHLGVRARLERADAAWILRVTDSKAEASISESFIAAQYGLPLAMFHSYSERQLYTQSALDRLFQMFNPDEQLERAKRCLKDHGRLLEFPFWRRSADNKYGNVIQTTAASNLIPGAMQIPRVDGSSGNQYSWHSIQSISPVEYRGPVTGLQVEKYHSYMADGLITHNCIFAFRGATPDVLMYPELPPDRYKVLKQSFRVPREVHAFAVNWISQVKHRIPKEYFPRDADGCVEFRRKGSYTNTEWLMEEAFQHTKEGRSVMFIVTCNYMLRTLIHDLRRAGLPYSNQYRPKATAWNPLRPGTELLDGVLSYLPGVPHSKGAGESVRPWTVDEIRKWAKCLKGMVRLWREKISNYPGESFADEKVLQMVIGDRYEELMQALEDAETDQGSPLAFFLKHLLAEHLKIPKGKPEDYVSKAEYLERILRYGNLSTLVERPLITVGTIHSVKGGQSDVVFLFPDVSQEQSDAAAYYDEDKDSQARVFYVAATRAREKLVILPPEDRGLSVPLHKYA